MTDMSNDMCTRQLSENCSLG